MIAAEASILIQMSVESVFRFVATDFFLNYPKWSPEVVELEKTSQEAVGIGTTGRQVRLDQGRRSESIFRVIAFEPNRRIAFASISGLQYRASYAFGSLPEGTRVSFSLEIRSDGLPFLLKPLMGGLVRNGTKQVVRNIKALLEQAG
jgi:polyketide cyclase/dehydrase/lipid transport protein